MWKKAFALSAREVKAARPPGTIEILDDIDHERTIRLNPAPTDDPRDPLTLSIYRKVAALLVVSVYAFVANYTSAVIAPALQIWPLAFPHDPRSYSDLSYLVAVHILLLGVSNAWWVPLSNWIGRRPTLLLATLLMTTCSIWCGVASSYKSLLAARILQGAGGGAADSVAPALVGDMFYVHQRGRAMAVYTVLLCIGSIVGGLTGGYIAFNNSWDTLFWVSVALSAPCFLGVAFLVPETRFNRIPVGEQSTEVIATTIDANTKELAASQQIERIQAGKSHPPYGYIKSLGFSSPSGHFLDHFIQPWYTLALPGTWVVMLQYAGLVGGVVTIALIGAQLVAMPPYLWAANAGLINVGGLIGAVLGWMYTHVLSDSLTKRQAKRSHEGVAEPEDRLPTIFFPSAVATCGFFVFGFCAQYPGTYRWIGLEVGFGMLVFGLMQIPSIGFNYIIDAYGSLAGDCFTMVTILRSIISFAWTFFVTEWIDSRGPAEPFGIFGMLMGLFSMLCVPLWIFGKRLRIATSDRVRQWNDQQQQS